MERGCGHAAALLLKPFLLPGMDSQPPTQDVVDIDWGDITQAIPHAPFLPLPLP